jgi:acetylglutamate synthase
MFQDIPLRDIGGVTAYKRNPGKRIAVQTQGDVTPVTRQVNKALDKEKKEAKERRLRKQEEAEQLKWMKQADELLDIDPDFHRKPKPERIQVGLRKELPDTLQNLTELPLLEWPTILSRKEKEVRIYPIINDQIIYKAGITISVNIDPRIAIEYNLNPTPKLQKAWRTGGMLFKSSEIGEIISPEQMFRIAEETVKPADRARQIYNEYVEIRETFKLQKEQSPTFTDEDIQESFWAWFKNNNAGRIVDRKIYDYIVTNPLQFTNELIKLGILKGK